MNAFTYRAQRFVALWRHRLRNYSLPTQCTITQRHSWVHTVEPGRPGRWGCTRCPMGRLTWPEGASLSLPEPRTWRDRHLGLTYFQVPTSAYPG